MAQRVVYASWPPTEITGGIKLVFRHVEILREAGIEAVVATTEGDRPNWFETRAPVVRLADVVREQDILVLPENHPEMLTMFADWSNRKVVFCQNHFMVFRGLAERNDYAEFGIRGILCEGRLVLDFCRRRFPSLPTALVSVAIDHQLFCFEHEKHVQIAFSPRKRPLEAAFVRDLFRAEHPQFRSIPWIEISGASEADVAQTLKESAIYLSLCRFESVGLSVLEAFACGCAVAGFTGFGARQYTTANNGFWAAEDDCLECVDQLAKAVKTVHEGGASYSRLVEAAHISASYYTRERLAEEITEFWRQFLEQEDFPKLQ